MKKFKQFGSFIFINAWTIINDTTKREKNGVRRFSKTALTMLTAWLLVIYVFVDDYIRNGYRTESFFAMLGVATAVKVTDSVSKKLNHQNDSE